MLSTIRMPTGRVQLRTDELIFAVLGHERTAPQAEGGFSVAAEAQLKLQP
jgi:hypothetical protein